LHSQLLFDNRPVEGFRPVDQTLMVTLVASPIAPDKVWRVAG